VKSLRHDRRARRPTSSAQSVQVIEQSVQVIELLGQILVSHHPHSLGMSQVRLRRHQEHVSPLATLPFLLACFNGYAAVIHGCWGIKSPVVTHRSRQGFPRARRRPAAINESKRKTASRRSLRTQIGLGSRRDGSSLPLPSPTEQTQRAEAGGRNHDEYSLRTCSASNAPCAPGSFAWNIRTVAAAPAVGARMTLLLPNVVAFALPKLVPFAFINPPP
jgi:hypothetical protein